MECVSTAWRDSSNASHAGTSTLDITDWRWQGDWSWRAIPTAGVHWLVQRCPKRFKVVRLQDAMLTRGLQPQIVRIICESNPYIHTLDLTGILITPTTLATIRDQITDLRTLAIGQNVGRVENELRDIFWKNALRHLTLKNNNIHGDAFLLLPPNLLTLTLHNCDNLDPGFLGLGLARTRTLQVLKIKGCAGLRAPSPLESLNANETTHAGLRRVYFYNCVLSPADPVGELDEDMEEMIIPDPYLIETATTFIHTHLHITHLTLSYCRWVTTEIVSAIGTHLRGLEYLNINGCWSLRHEADLDPLGALKNLHTLHICAMYYTVRAACLASMPGLRFLEARDSAGITDEDVCGLLENNKDVTKISLEGCRGIGSAVPMCALRVARPGDRQRRLYLFLGGTRAIPRARYYRNYLLYVDFIRNTEPLVLYD